LVAGLDIRPDVQNVYRMDRMTGHIDLVSVNVDGTGSGNDDSKDAVISADGSVVAFSSDADNLVSSTPHGFMNIFVRNFVTGTTQLVSVRTDGTGGGNGFSGKPAISAGGTVVTFESNATNLHPLDTNNTYDIFARNLLTQTTYLVSVSSDGSASGNATSDKPVISADGSVVAFESEAWNLHPSKTVGNRWEVYARDLQTGTTYLVSSGTLGHTALNPVISANGSVVAYNLLDGGVYARNIVTGTNYIVSIDPTGTFAGAGDGEVISADGSVVAFRSSTSLSALDTNGFSDIYARNIVSGTTFLVSVNLAGTAKGIGHSYDPAISADGNVVAFRSEATNLSVLKASNSYFDIFARNLFTGTT